MTFSDYEISAPKELTVEEAEQVSGGDLFTAAVGAATGFAASHGLPRLNRIVIAFGAGVASY